MGFVNRKLYDLGREAEVLKTRPFIERGKKDAEDFYRTAGDRDEVFLRKTLGEMRRKNLKTAVLITGGFHTANLTRIMREENVSYTVVTPAVRHETNLARYEHILLSRAGLDKALPKPIHSATGRPDRLMMPVSAAEVPEVMSLAAVRLANENKVGGPKLGDGSRLSVTDSSSASNGTRMISDQVDRTTPEGYTRVSPLRESRSYWPANFWKALMRDDANGGWMRKSKTLKENWLERDSKSVSIVRIVLVSLLDLSMMTISGVLTGIWTRSWPQDWMYVANFLGIFSSAKNRMDVRPRRGDALDFLRTPPQSVKRLLHDQDLTGDNSPHRQSLQVLIPPQAVRERRTPESASHGSKVSHGTLGDQRSSIFGRWDRSLLSPFNSKREYTMPQSNLQIAASRRIESH